MLLVVTLKLLVLRLGILLMMRSWTLATLALGRKLILVAALRWAVGALVPVKLPDSVTEK